MRTGRALWIIGMGLAWAMAAPALANEPKFTLFGGEDILRGDPWHHEDMTCRAAAGDASCGGNRETHLYPGTGFSPDAAHAMAWHADYIDSYLYSPLWWAQAIDPGGLLDGESGMLNRYKASMAQYWHLASLHFDDLNSSAEIEATWRRYLSGLLIGLNWAAENEDVDAAHHLLGLSMHAVQDFYSHSTWIDNPDRRSQTYLDLLPAQRRSFPLLTGAYEEEIAPIQHGQFNLACSLYDRPAARRALDLLCTRGLPTSSISFCEAHRECLQSDNETVGVVVAGRETNMAVLAPPGIAMDTTWLAEIAADQRGLTTNRGRDAVRREISLAERIGSVVPASPLENTADRRTQERLGRAGEAIRGGDFEAGDASTDDPSRALEATILDARNVCRDVIGHGQACERESDYLFAEAKHLAIISSQQWLRLVSEYMAVRHPAFWREVQTCRDAAGRSVCHGDFSYPRPPGEITDQFERYSQLPFQFMTGGHDGPAANPHSDGWYLRVRIDTANSRGAGTDGDIYLEAGGEQFLLDYLNTRDPDSAVRQSILTYNDFEAGDSQVYTVGPFAELPREFTLFNDSASRREVRRAFFRSWGNRIRDRLEGLRHTFRNDQDYIGHIIWSVSRDELDAIIAEGNSVTYEGESRSSVPGEAYVLLDGGAEGVYRVRLTVRRTPWDGGDTYRRWAEYEIGIRGLAVLRESRVDGATRSDEPFFFFALSAYGVSEPEAHSFGPYSNIGTDRRDRRLVSLSHVFAPVRLPPEGIVTLTGEGWESDNERASDRNDLFTEFSTGIDPSDADDYNQFLYEFGRTLGGDWKVDHLLVHAFYRGEHPQLGQVLEAPVSVWIDEDQRQTFALNTRRVQSIGAELSGFRITRSLDGTPREPVWEARWAAPSPSRVAAVPPLTATARTLSSDEGDSRASPSPAIAAPQVRRPDLQTATPVLNAPRLSCADHVQGQIAWNAQGTTSWAQGNVDRLCAGAEDSPQPAQCFEQTLAGLNGESWTWQPALELCAGTFNAGARTDCYRQNRAAGHDRLSAIAACTPD